MILFPLIRSPLILTSFQPVTSKSTRLKNRKAGSEVGGLLGTSKKESKNPSKTWHHLRTQNTYNTYGGSFTLALVQSLILREVRISELPSGKLTWLAGISPISIGTTSSIPVHFPASYVSLPECTSQLVGGFNPFEKY